MTGMPKQRYGTEKKFQFEIAGGTHHGAGCGSAHDEGRRRIRAGGQHAGHLRWRSRRQRRLCQAAVALGERLQAPSGLTSLRLAAGGVTSQITISKTLLTAVQVGSRLL